jgi:hypothetical protein
VLLLFTNLLGNAAGGFHAPTPPPPTNLPGGSQRRRGALWEPSVAFAIAAAQEERRLWREAHAAPAPKHPSARVAPPAAALFERIEVVQLAIKRAHSARVKAALRVIEEEEQTKLAALAREELAAATGVVRSIKAAREELEAAQAIMLILAQGRREPIGDEEAAAILMNMLMNVKH